jgi:uroporphyrinogen-III synthase
VVVTRERGKNGKLMKALRARGIAVLELPLVATAAGPDQARLPGVLRAQQFDWVALTSPEAANVFLAAWEQAGKPQVMPHFLTYFCRSSMSTTSGGIWSHAS